MKRIAILFVAGLALVALATWVKLGSGSLEAEALAAYRHGDYGRALEKFRQAAPTSPDPGRAAHNQAAALAKLRRYAEAQKYYQCEEETGGGLRAARAAYDQANCEVQRALPKDSAGKPKPDPELLAKAIKHYRSCLEHENEAGANLFADARHNLELAKLLLAQVEPEPADATLARSDKNKAAAGKQHPEDQCPT
jgi:tetratricopeptide (TPR) repeat protein